MGDSECGEVWHPGPCICPALGLPGALKLDHELGWWLSISISFHAVVVNPPRVQDGDLILGLSVVFP